MRLTVILVTDLTAASEESRANLGPGCLKRAAPLHGTRLLGGRMGVMLPALISRRKR